MASLSIGIALVLIAKGERMVFAIVVALTAVLFDVWAYYQYRKVKNELQKEYYNGKDA